MYPFGLLQREDFTYWNAAQTLFRIEEHWLLQAETSLHDKDEHIET